VERGGRRFPEERLVFAGEPAELPEPVPRGDLRHGCPGWGTVAQGPPARDASGATSRYRWGSSRAAPGSRSAMSGPTPRSPRKAPVCIAADRGFPPRLCETVAGSSRGAAAPTCPRQPRPCRGSRTMASISACSRPRAASGCAMISGASSASCPAAACSRWELCHRGLWGCEGQRIIRRRQVASGDRRPEGSHFLYRQRNGAKESGPA